MSSKQGHKTEQWTGNVGSIPTEGTLKLAAAAILLWVAYFIRLQIRQLKLEKKAAKLGVEVEIAATMRG